MKPDSRKLSPIFVDLFPISKVVNSVAIRLKLPRSMCIHPTFHVSKVKPLVENPVVPRAPAPPPLCIIDGKLVNTVKKLLVVHRRG